MSGKSNKLTEIQNGYASWDKNQSSPRGSCDSCSASSGDGCHGDGSCGGDGGGDE